MIVLLFQHKLMFVKKNILEYTKLQQNQTTTFQLSQPLYVKITQLKLD